MRTKPPAKLKLLAKRNGPGRPTLYNDAIAVRIIGRLVQGYTIREACRLEGGVPDENTVYRWLTERPDFGEAVTRARKAGAPALIDRAWAIADDASRDVLEERRPDGSIRPVPNHAAVKRDELRVNQLRYMASKADPERYGDRQHIEHSGSLVGLADQLDAAQRRLELAQRVGVIDAHSTPVARIEDKSA